MENTLRTRARQKHENKTKAQAQETQAQETQETQAKEKNKEQRNKKQKSKKKSKKARTISIFGEFHITRTTDEHFDRPAWS